MKTPEYNPKEWTDHECAEGLLEAIFNMGQEAADGLMALCDLMKDHAKIMEHLEMAFRKQRKRDMPECIREGIARAIEGGLRGLAKVNARANRSSN